ncbi:Hypothetical predicted protein [Octopus vulgaris]|uniref:Uncharacterized protein n=1 Tax=Octopus vulgaris TaxID=6645 RepID=A0AA36B6A0_OCTVU|nr:Hypothetical predicted protein [Octopus vulgaris]
MGAVPSHLTKRMKKTAGVGVAVGGSGVGNGIAIAGYGEGTVVIILGLVIGGRAAIVARGVISFGFAGVSARTTVAAAVIDLIAGGRTGSGAAAIGVVGSAAVES